MSNGRKAPGSGVDQGLAQLQQAGQNVVLGLFSLLRTASIHDLHNRALDRPVMQVLEALEPFLRRAQGRFSVVALEGQLYVDDIRVRLPSNAFHIVQEIEALLGGKSVGGVSFHHAPSPGELRRFAHTFQNYSPPEGADPLEAMQRALVEAGTGSISVTRRVRAQYDGEELLAEATSTRVATTITYAKAVSALSQLLEDPSGRGQLRQRHMSRVVRELADCASETLEYLIGLTEIGSNRTDRARLVVDTCVVAIALARAMNLPRSLIADLGVAIMADGHSEDVESGARPPSVTALLGLVEVPRWTTSLLRRTLVSAQRSQPLRGSGGLPDQYRLARIHRVARDYVALTHGLTPETLEERDALTPLEALSFLSQLPPSVYDGVVISHLVRVIGMYPVGSLLLFSDGRAAYVVGRDEAGEPIVLERVAHRRFGERLTLEEVGARVVGVAAETDASERASAVLGEEEQRDLQRAGLDLAKGSALARVQIQRIAVRREREREPED